MIREERRDRQKIRDDANDVKLKGLVKELKAIQLHLILCTKNKGYWMTIQGTMLTGTVLEAK